MFGQIRARREKKRYKRDIAELRQELENAKKTQPNASQEMASHQEQVNKLANEQKDKDKLTREEGKKYADEVLAREYQGLNPKQRQSLQESANYQIDKDIQNYQRKLSGQQGSRGVQGGAAYAQRQDLARLGGEAQQQMQRDLTSLDSELAMKKAAAAYNIEQGEVANDQLRNQMALDTLNSYDQRKYQKWLSEQANKLFQRV